MQKMMPAIVKAKAEPGLWLEQVPVPEVGPDDVLIRTKKASICGTDIHIYNLPKAISSSGKATSPAGIAGIVSPAVVIFVRTRKASALIAPVPGPNSSPFPRLMHGTRILPFRWMSFPASIRLAMPSTPP